MSSTPSSPEQWGGPQPGPAWIPRLFTVASVRRELEGIYTFQLRAEDGGGFNFAPGQFNMLYVFGHGEVPISISGDPAQPDTLVHTVRAVGKTTGALCALRPGGTVGVRGPFGAPWPMQTLEGRDLVFLTSGLGLAPLRPAFYHALNHRDRFGSVTLLYGARTPERLLFAAELQAWRARTDLKVELAVGSAGPDWDGHIGVATSLVEGIGLLPGRTSALICSSERMMRSMARELNLAGIPDGDIHLSLERNMRCGMGLCGHCQLGSTFICKDGPVYALDQVAGLMARPEL